MIKDLKQKLEATMQSYHSEENGLLSSISDCLEDLVSKEIITLRKAIEIAVAFYTKDDNRLTSAIELLEGIKDKDDNANYLWCGLDCFKFKMNKIQELKDEIRWAELGI